MPKNKRIMDLCAHTPRTRSRGIAADGGFMLIEVMVSAVLLIIISLATLAVIDRAQTASGANRARSVASALGQQDQDRIRQWPFSRFDSLIDEKNATPGQQFQVNGASGKDVVIDGRTYNIKTWLAIDTDNSQAITACLSGWAKKKVRIHTEITSPTATGVKKVVMESFRVPQISDKSDKGSVIVKLMRADGSGAKGVDVTVAVDAVGGASTTAKTFDDGCVVFNDVDAGKKKVSWKLASWGDENGAAEVTRFVTVSAGKVSQMSGRFDQLATRDLTFVTDNAVAAQWRSATLVQPGITTVNNGRRTSVTASRVLAASVPASLFPFQTPYGVYAGDCWANNPDVWPGSNTSPNSITATYGSTGAANVYLPLVTIQVNGRSPANSTLYSAKLKMRGVQTQGGSGTWSEMSGCGDKVVPYSFATPAAAVGALNGTTTAAGVLKEAVPYGTWTVCVSNGSVYKTVDLNNTPDGDSTVSGYVAPSMSGPSGVRGVTIDMSSGTSAGACPTADYS